MKTFKGFVIKEFKQIYRDKRTLLVLFGMPVIMMILFGYAIRNDVRNVEIAVLDNSRDQMTRKIINKLDASNYFDVSMQISRPEEIDLLFQQGNIDEVIVFEKGFSAAMQMHEMSAIQIISDASDPNLSQLVREYTTAIIRDFEAEIDQKGEMPVPLKVNTSMLFNSNLESTYLFVPGLIAVILMLICSLMTSISITREKEMGNMEVLLVSPLKRYQIITGKVLPYMVISMGIVIIILALARMVYNVPFRGSYFFLLAESLLFIFTALSLGVLISTRANNQQTAMMISLAGLLLPTVLLSGFIFPVQSMPVPLQMISSLIPARWFLVIVRSIMLKDATFLYLWKETVILLGMLVFLTILSIRSFKERLE